MVEIVVIGKWSPHFDESGGTLELSPGEVDKLLDELLSLVGSQSVELEIMRSDEEPGND